MYREIISKPITVVNSLTGEFNNYSTALIEHKTITKSKRGWTKMYRLAYDEVARAMTSKIEYDIFTAVRDSNVPKTFILNFKQESIAKIVGTSKGTVSKVIKKLKDLDFIRRDGSTIIMNPFVYVPPLIKDDDIHLAQEAWLPLQ